MSRTPKGPRDPQRIRVLRGAAIAAVVVAAMVGLAYASVPLYRAFCAATGFGGTPGRATANTSSVLNRKVSVRFDTNVRNDLPWTFQAEQQKVDVKIGATAMAYFKVHNTSNRAITARATYNVLPNEAAYYFRKLQCFCFSDQTLKAGETAEFPMIFFVDPDMIKDDEAKNTNEIVLSYTFFPTPDGQPKAAAVKASTHPAVKASSLALGGQARAGL
ncbi:MAG: cytochrome c oxidase assembly protein [Caulobacteraceae bacterium]